MKTSLNTVSSDIIVVRPQARGRTHNGHGVSSSQTSITPRANIVSRRAARWARRANH